MIKETKVASCLKKSRSMQEWKCTQGVNLSVGYGEEHTERRVSGYRCFLPGDEVVGGYF
ncbi:hypothetical protein [Sporosarcina sp. FA15]|uniref:hypothetical protein n=1 Tax=Sporosarcina sp. FA15 TaxID=3413031 RepID=UPI003F657A0D